MSHELTKSKFEQDVRAIIDNSFKASIADAKKRTSIVAITMEDSILIELSDLYPDHDVNVDVTACVSTTTTYNTVVTNHTLGMNIMQENTEAPKDMDQAALNMAQRSNIAIEVTRVIRDTLTDAYLEAEVTGIDSAADHIRTAIMEAIPPVVGEHKWDVFVEVNENWTATVKVTVEKVTSVRLRATRQFEQEAA